MKIYPRAGDADASQGRKLPPYHLYEYSPRTVRLLCAEAGLTVIREHMMLTTPQFLTMSTAPLDVALRWAFGAMRWGVEHLSLRGGHHLVITQCRASC